MDLGSSSAEVTCIVQAIRSGQFYNKLFGNWYLTTFLPSQMTKALFSCFTVLFCNFYIDF